MWLQVDYWMCRVRLKCDGTRAETRFRLSPKRTSPFNRRGRQFSRLLAAELCTSALVMLDTPHSEVVWEYWLPLHSPVSPSLPLPCITVCHQVSNALYQHFRRTCCLHPQQAENICIHYHTTWCHTLEDSRTIYLHHHENSNTAYVCSFPSLISK